MHLITRDKTVLIEQKRIQGLNSHSQTGFGLIESLVMVVVIAIIAVGGWAVYKHYHKATTKNNTAVSKTTAIPKTTGTQSTNPYAGWKIATSTRAKFSIKYPTNWIYSAAVGTNDSVEHITITGTNLELKIDSYNGKDPTNGGTVNTTCTDCKSTLNTQTFTISNMGVLHLDTVTYTLDNGLGNAIILRQPDGTYYIPSPAAGNVVTSFRGISNLDSLQAYQNETPAQFTSNPDYATAQQILKSVSY